MSDDKPPGGSHVGGSNEQPVTGNQAGGDERENIAGKEHEGTGEIARIQALFDAGKLEDALSSAFSLLEKGNRRLFAEIFDLIKKILSKDPGVISESQLQMLVNHLDDEDDIIRASVILALKPVIIARAAELFPILENNVRNSKIANSIEESIRLLGFMAQEHPDKIATLIPELLAGLLGDNLNIAKRSLQALEVLSNTRPDKIESILKESLEKIDDGSLKEGVETLLLKIIKNRDIKGKEGGDDGKDEEKLSETDAAAELIPDVEPAGPGTEDEGSETQGEEGELPARDEEEGEERDDESIKKAIEDKIEKEFSKIEENAAGSTPELKDLKEITSPKDLENRSDEQGLQPQVSTSIKEIMEDQSPVMAGKGVPALSEPLHSTDQGVGREEKGPVPGPGQADDLAVHVAGEPAGAGEKLQQEDIVQKQITLKEKELKRREEEIKRLELERKELELVARELELEREALKQAKLEKLELEVKRKEELVREKELALKLKELEEKERKLREKEKEFS